MFLEHFTISMIFEKVQTSKIQWALPNFYRTQVSLGSDLWVLMSVTDRLFADLTDATLADDDSNSIPTEDDNGQSQAMWKCK